MVVHELFEDYTTEIDRVDCYFAGLPGYPRNFSRDTIIAGIIAADHHLIDNQLCMSALHQGETFDPHTGEEPGKIHHEYPGVTVTPPYLTTYNACDTTSLYLIGLEFLRHLNRHESEEFLETHQESIESALGYLDRHIDDDLFWEEPPPGADHFSLRITYWKDSILPSAGGEKEPEYPATYALAHFQAARGLLAAANLLRRDDLLQRAGVMFERGISQFITDQAFCVLKDRAGRFEQTSSDELHALAYIPKKYKDQLPLDAMCERAEELVTEAGLACTPKDISDQLADQYHGYVVWVFEQAMIHYGCEKFDLQDMARIAERCAPHIDTGRELLGVAPAITPLGNNHQLWSVAAKIYFQENYSLRQTRWL